MATRHLRVVEEEKDVWARMLGAPTDTHRGWLTYLLDGIEKALADLDDLPPSREFETTAKDLADLKGQLRAALATLQPVNRT